MKIGQARENENGRVVQQEKLAENFPLFSQGNWLKAWPAKELVLTKAKTKLGKAPNKNQSQQFLIYHLKFIFRGKF